MRVPLMRPIRVFWVGKLDTNPNSSPRRSILKIQIRLNPWRSTLRMIQSRLCRVDRRILWYSNTITETHYRYNKIILVVAVPEHSASVTRTPRPWIMIVTVTTTRSTEFITWGWLLAKLHERCVKVNLLSNSQKQLYSKSERYTRLHKKTRPK